MRDYRHFRDWLREKYPGRKDFYATKKMVEQRLRFYKQLNVHEYSLRKKWEEINSQVKLPENLDDIKSQVYTETRIPEPKLILCDDRQKKQIWNIFRIYITSFSFSPAPARNLKYLVIDERTQKYLGIIKISSELYYTNHFLNIARRHLFDKGQHILTCSVLVPVQPFGYNLVGGKLLALLSVSNQICHDWMSKYNVRPILFTTTSLYGSFSQYSGLNKWKSIGQINSNVNHTLPKSEYTELKDFLLWYSPRTVYNLLVDNKTRRNIKNRFLQHAYLRLRIPENIRKISYKRGRFICPIYTNYIDFLKNNISESQLEYRFDNSIKNLINEWENKAYKRKQDLEYNGFKCDADSYDWLYGLKWDTAYGTIYKKW